MSGQPTQTSSQTISVEGRQHARELLVPSPKAPVLLGPLLHAALVKAGRTKLAQAVQEEGAADASGKTPGG
jgi:hypothetical protein